MIAERQLQTLGVFVHGVLFAFHALGIVYNARRRNRFDVIAHASAATYDLWAVSQHVKALHRTEDR